MGPSSTEEAKAASALRGGGLAAGGAAAIGLGAPVALLLLARGGLASLAAGSAGLLSAEAALVSVAAALAVLALFLFRRAFGHLKHVDRRLRPASLLCLLGSTGAIALVIAAAYVSGSSTALSSCLHGEPSHALSCLRAQDPSAGILAVVGFWLVWLGAAGVALGLVVSGRHFSRGAVTAGGVLYAVLVADLAAPFAGLLVRLPGSAYALGVAPAAAVAAAVLVYAGARTPLAHQD